MSQAVRQIYPEPADLGDRELAARYSYPDQGGSAPYWLRANMVASLDGAATVGGRSGGLSEISGTPASGHSP